MNAGSHLSLLATLFVATTVSGLTQSPRPMVVDDLFHLQTLGDIALSPDGELLAIVIQRAWSDPETFRPYDMLGNDQADVWILPTEGGPPTNVTRDASDESGYWNPVWSPDGQRLALLSTAGGDNVRLYMWDRRSGRVQRMSERGVDLRAGASANADGSPNPIQWVDDRRLLVSLLPEGEQPVAFRLRRQTPRIASEEWVKAGRGLAPTSSVLESGFAAARPTGSVAQLVIIDVVTDVARVLVEDSIRHALLSPDREHVAVIVQDRPVAPEATRPLPSASSGHSRLGIIGLRNGSTVQWVDRIFNPTVGLGTNPHRWSPSGSKLAVLASDSLAPTATKQVFVISPQAATALKLAEGFTASALAWSGEQLLTLARPPGAQRSDWWKLPAGQPKQDARKLTGDVVAVPAEIFASVRSNEVIGIADGEVWSFDLTNGSHQNLTGALGPRISSVVWPREDQRHASPVSSLILRAHEGTASSFVRVELAMSVANASSVPQPAEATTLAAYHLERRLVVFTAPRNPHGSYLWTGRNQSRDFARRIALNDHLAGIAEAERKLIEYRSADGQDLKGVILLPVGYEPGKRYPLVTWVYPGFVVQDTTMGFWVNKNQAHMDNLHILAGQGYAVLIPSMPSKGRPRDPYHELPSGVLPAVDRVIALGIVDPERVAVMGQSAGGFATYGLITQTTRFKAAVAISGYANLASNYGAFRGDERYTHGIDEKLTQVRFSEGDVIGLGAPPWQDADRYTRNSPVFFLNRVETPLLILHGDLDYVPLQQAEEVFTNLYRLGKRVRFVRYWGEGHGVGDSAANIRDRWHQILDWLRFHMPAAQ